MNTTTLSADPLTQEQVLEFMRVEHARLSGVTADLWQGLKSAEAEMQPFKNKYDLINEQWYASQRLRDALEALIKSKTI